MTGVRDKVTNSCCQASAGHTSVCRRPAEGISMLHLIGNIAGATHDSRCSTRRRLAIAASLATLSGVTNDPACFSRNSRRVSSGGAASRLPRSLRLRIGSAATLRAVLAGHTPPALHQSQTYVCNGQRNQRWTKRGQHLHCTGTAHHIPPARSSASCRIPRSGGHTLWSYSRTLLGASCNDTCAQQVQATSVTERHCHAWKAQASHQLQPHQKRGCALQQMPTTAPPCNPVYLNSNQLRGFIAMQYSLAAVLLGNCEGVPAPL